MTAKEWVIDAEATEIQKLAEATQMLATARLQLSDDPRAVQALDPLTRAISNIANWIAGTIAEEETEIANPGA